VAWVLFKALKLVALPAVRGVFEHPVMSTKLRQVIFGSRIAGVNIRA